MTQAQSLATLIPVLGSVAFLMLGNGVLGTLVALRLAEAGAGAVLIGLVSAAYFSGLTLGSLQGFRLIRRVGHIRAFAIFASVLSAASLGHAVFAGAGAWAALRLVEGFCVAGTYMCVESWLNDVADNRSRGRVLSIYMATLYAAMAAGQQLLLLDQPGRLTLFVVIGMLLSVSLVPISLARATPPTLPDVVSLGLPKLYRASPLGVAGTFLSGCLLGAIYGLAPVFAARSGFGTAGTAAFMTAIVLGGMILQWPLGRLSDVFDRRTVIIVTAAALAIVSLGTFLAAGGNDWILLAFAIVFGGLAFGIYPLCAAHTNDHVAKADLVAASGGLILVNSVGSILGPIAASGVMAPTGPGGLFLFTALVALAAAGFGLWRTRVRPHLPSAAQGAFRALPSTTPVAAPLRQGEADPAEGMAEEKGAAGAAPS